MAEFSHRCQALAPAQRLKVLAARGLGADEPVCVRRVQVAVLRVAQSQVCLVDCDRQRLDLTTEELRRKFPDAVVHCFAADLRDRKQLEQAFVHAVQQFGKLHVVANNAGVLDESDPELMATVNLVAPYQGTLLGLQHMERGRGRGEGGVIINTASNAGFSVIPEMCFYTATKNGVITFTRAIAASERCSTAGVRVSCLCPNSTDTELSHKFVETLNNRKLMEEIRRTMVKPEVVADAFLYLVSDDGANGKALVVEGPGAFVYHEFDKDGTC